MIDIVLVFFICVLALACIILAVSQLNFWYQLRQLRHDLKCWQFSSIFGRGSNL